MLSNWCEAADSNFISDQDAHIWSVDLSIPDPVYNLLFSVLHKEEQQRAERFHFERDRRAYVAVRGHVRFLLSRYLKRPPSDFMFSYNSYGKPFLKHESIRFNVSHSKERGLIAIDPSMEIGVDIEWMRPDFGGLKIAKRFFSETEIKELESLSAEERQKGFFNGWSRKEAYIKARGKGLAIPLSKFSVRLSPHAECALLSTEHDPEAIHRFKLSAIQIDPHYAAAVVTDINRKGIKLFRTNGLLPI